MRVERALDVIGSAVGLLLLAPVLLLICAVVFVDSGRPVFFRQKRVGQNFRRFTLYKFRTMCLNAERSGLLTSSNDPRVTRAGALLRQWKLDELPQLWNVLKGEMALVGCRPELPKYVELFRGQYGQLLAAPPGLSDPASLHFADEERMLGGENIEDKYLSSVLPAKLKLSIESQRNRTQRSDAIVLLRTIAGIAFQKSACCKTAGTGIEPYCRR